MSSTRCDGDDVTQGAKADAAVTNPASSASVVALLKGLLTQLGGGVSSASIPVASAGYTSQPTVTRPANADAYTAGDVIGGAITFTSAGPSGGHVVITGADLRINVTAVPSGMTSFRLHLYDVTPPSALADNAAWDLPSGDRASYLGYVDLGTPVDVGSTLFVQVDGVNKKVKLNASTSLFGYLVTAGGFTPAGNSEVYAPRIQTLGV